MEIRKADSKGRVTGFTAKTWYRVVTSENGTITAYPVRSFERFTEESRNADN